MSLVPNLPNDDQEPVVVLGLDDPQESNVPIAISTSNRARKNWWDDEQTTPPSPQAGRRHGSTALQKAHDVALVAGLMRKHCGDARSVQSHCMGLLGWSNSRWRTVSTAVIKIFTGAAKETAAVHTIGLPMTDTEPSGGI